MNTARIHSKCSRIAYFAISCEERKEGSCTELRIILFIVFVEGRPVSRRYEYEKNDFSLWPRFVDICVWMKKKNKLPQTYQFQVTCIE